MTAPTIPEFFGGKRAFITGATGFMGKVLVEKLLRSCNGLETIYLLVRGKKGKSAAERWAETTQLPCFDRLKAEFPTALDSKVQVIEGDVREDKLGMSSADYQMLVKNVNIIFHVAASVRFNDSLPEAIRMNTYGTKNVVDLGAQIEDLLVLVHVSTTYCYCNQRQELEEEIYPTSMSWEKALEISEGADPVSFEILNKKFTDHAPNTYVYSKGLAEQIINDYRDRLPAVIFRPSIVISSWKEPLPGWIDNFNGPIGLVIAGGKGVIRVALSDPEAIPDYMAVDISIKAMIIAAWKTGIARKTKPLGTLEVYNSSSTSKSVSNRELLELCKTVHKECPLEEVLWVPSYAITGNFTEYKVRAIFCHFLFAVLADLLLRILGKKPMLMKIHIKIHQAMMALGYFTTKAWTFKNPKFRALNDAISPRDKDDFDFNFDDLEPMDFFRSAAVGGKQYLMHEDMANVELAKTKAKRMFLADKIIKWVAILWLAYYIFGRLSSYL